MKNKKEINIIDLKTNIATQTTYSPTQNREIDYERFEDSVNDIIARIFEEQENAYFVLNDLKTLTNLFLIDVPKDSRPTIFRQLNSLIGSLMVSHKQNVEIYQAVFNMMTAFKDQVENHPQQDEELAEMEWTELQKVVYLLTDWEDGLENVDRLPLTVDR
jgi:hypothetical protein